MKVGPLHEVEDESAGGNRGITEVKYGSIDWVWPPHSNSDHQEYYIFNRESL